MVYIIAECGLSHNGSLDIAIEMIRVAKECGADCVKFQAYHTINLCDPLYQRELYSKLQKCELFPKDFIILKDYCTKVGIDFLCTPDDLEYASFLNGLQNKFKISSVGAANLHLLRLINCFKKPVLISDGLISEPGKEIVDKILKDCDITWMSCVSNYPATENHYADKFALNGFPKGLSDHTLGIETAISSIRLGVEIIEKHFTLDKTQDGFDYHMSINPDELKKLCEAVK